jgi:hypothetical protein
VHDADGGSQLLTETTGEIDQLSGDGTYDKRKIYEACAEREVKQITIPPARNARIWQHGNSKQPPLPPSGPPPLKWFIRTLCEVKAAIEHGYAVNQI